MIHKACSKNEHRWRCWAPANSREYLRREIEALVSCSRGVHMGTTCPNLQLKLHEKIRAREKKPKEKEPEK